jgi:ATP-dependent helicase HrpA
VRFTAQTSPTALVKVMTDGILLNEIRTDRRLEAYDTLIIDEAHERTLNIDFILGYLRSIEKQRPDLKVIITSATIDPERFARHFDNAPIIRIEGRTFPVAVRYRPRDEEQDLAAVVTSAAREFAAEPVDAPLSATCWCSCRASGGFAMRSMLWALRAEGLRDPAVCAAHERAATADPRAGKAPRIVPAGHCRDVADGAADPLRIDSGWRVPCARHVQSPVSSRSPAPTPCNAGRCGRLAGRLRAAFGGGLLARPAYTEPEILRTGLAGVLLRLEALRLGPIEDFPFIDAPPARAVSDAYQLLYLLGAVDDERRLTPDGELMARLPVDPRVARLLVVAQRDQSLREGLVIAAALSVVDPREYGVDPDAARRKHELFADPRSDFNSYLLLWSAYRRERRGGERALRAWCKSITRPSPRECHDVHGQLHGSCRRSAGGHVTRTPTTGIHQAVSPRSSTSCRHDECIVYRGMRDARAVSRHPLAKKRPRGRAAERIATERHSAYRGAGEHAAAWPRICCASTSRSTGNAERGSYGARVVTLFGLTLASERRIDYGRSWSSAACSSARLAADRGRRRRTAVSGGNCARAPCTSGRRACASAICSWASRGWPPSTTSACRRPCMIGRPWRVGAPQATATPCK